MHGQQFFLRRAIVWLALNQNHVFPRKTFKSGVQEHYCDAGDNTLPFSLKFEIKDLVTQFELTSASPMHTWCNITSSCVRMAICTVVRIVNTTIRTIVFIAYQWLVFFRL